MRGFWFVVVMWFLLLMSIGNVVSYFSQGVVTDEYLLEAIKKERVREIKFNEFSKGDMVQIGILPYITKTTFIHGWLFKYRVDGVGMVPYWYKSADTLDKIFSGYQHHEPTEKEKLKLE